VEVDRLGWNVLLVSIVCNSASRGYGYSKLQLDYAGMNCPDRSINQ